MAIKAGFKLDWYFLTVNKKWEQGSRSQKRKAKKPLSSQTSALKNREMSMTFGKVHKLKDMSNLARQ